MNYAVGIMSEHDDIIPYTLFLTLSGADRVLRTFLQRELAPKGVGIMEWLLMSYVNDGPKEGCSMTSIAKALGVTLPQVTALANNLLNLKLIKQKTQAADRRTRHVTLLPAGSVLVADIDTRLRGAIQTWIKQEASITYDDIMDYMRVASLIQQCALDDSK